MINCNDRTHKYPLTGYFCFLSITLFIMVWYWGCARYQKSTSEIKIHHHSPYVEKEIVVPRENVRVLPNGHIIGSVAMGDSVDIVYSKGNWVNCFVGDSMNGWIWAPSLGYSKISFLNVNTYFPNPDHRLIPFGNLEQRLGPPSTITQESPHYLRVVYDNSLKDGTYLFGTTQFQQLELVVVQPNGLIAQVTIDFGEKESTATEMLSLFGFDDVPPTKSGFQNVRWDNAFSGLGLVIMDRYQGSFRSFSSVKMYKEHPDRWKEVIVVRNQSCQIGDNNQVSVNMMIESIDDMAYSDISFVISFYDCDRNLIAEDTIENLSDVLPPLNQTEIFVDRNIPLLGGRKDITYNIDIISARPLFTTIAP